MLLFLFPGSTKTTAVSISKLLRERVPLEELVARCFGLVESRRADSTADLISLRVCGQWLLGVAWVCNFRIDKGVSVPCLARHCRALHPG